MTATLVLQRALAARGFPPGPLDGAFGRLTRAALVAFQTREALPATGVADAATLDRLTPGQSRASIEGRAPIEGRASIDPPWLVEGRRWMGLAEIPGARSNARILGWGRAIADWYRDDDTPWCGAFVHAQIAATLPDEPLPANALFARNWATFGVPLKRAAPGAVLVFARGAGGHVGFYLGEDAGRLRVLGGNQSNRVSETWIARSRLIAMRWPKTATPPSGGPVAASAPGALSVNEA